MRRLRPATAAAGPFCQSLPSSRPASRNADAPDEAFLCWAQVPPAAQQPVQRRPASASSPALAGPTSRVSPREKERERRERGRELFMVLLQQQCSWTDDGRRRQLAGETMCTSSLHTRFASPRPTTPFCSIDLLLPPAASAVSDALPELSGPKSLAEASDSSMGLREHSKLASVPDAAHDPIRLKGLRPKTYKMCIILHN